MSLYVVVLFRFTVIILVRRKEGVLFLLFVSIKFHDIATFIKCDCFPSLSSTIQ